MRKHFIFTFILGFIFSFANGQGYEKLQKKWMKSKLDTIAIKAGLTLYDIYYEPFNDSIKPRIQILQKILKQSENINFPYGIARSSYFLGNNYLFLNKSPDAIRFYLTSLKVCEKYNFQQDIALAKMGIGLVHLGQHDWNKAVQFFKSSLNINRKIKNEIRTSTQYYLIGYSLIEVKRFNEAKYYIDSALTMKIKLKSQRGIQECQLAMAHLFKGKHMYDSANYYYTYVTPLFINNKEWVPASYCYSSLAEIDLTQGHYSSALLNANKAFKYAELNSEIYPKLKSSEILYKVNFKIGNEKDAYKYLLLFNELKDSIENKDFTAQISIAQATYDFEKEQSVIAAAQAEKELRYKAELKYENRKQIILAIIALMAIILFIVIIFAYRTVSNQKQISEGLLLNILPEQTTIELKKYGKSLPKNHERVSIMFCDIKNFSHLAEALTPHNIVNMLDYYFKNFDDILEIHGLEKIKTIGDAYMCAGGLHENQKYHEKNIILAAFDFIKFIKKVESDMLNRFGHAFHFRIGIHIGNVVSGVVGRKKFTYDIWGDAVNIAARMEQNSIAGKINVSGDTYESFKDEFDFEYRGKIEAKNKGSIDMYFVNSV